MALPSFELSTFFCRDEQKTVLISPELSFPAPTRDEVLTWARPAACHLEDFLEQWLAERLATGAIDEPFNIMNR